jgi:Flp pilus assembly pilin Flp
VRKEIIMRKLIHRLRDDSGMNTAEYAVGTLAAVAFAGLLFKVVTSDAVRQALTNLFERALG